MVRTELVLAVGAWSALQLLGCGGRPLPPAPGPPGPPYTTSSTAGPVASCPSSCGAVADRNVTTKDGFTNNTGFAGAAESACCNICDVVVPIPDNKYDWDNVIMDSLFVPQFCNALESGHDFTLTNTEGTTCRSKVQKAKAKMQIHGLWPNWNADYATCCLGPAPVDVALARKWSFFDNLQEEWSDAAATDQCGVCFNLNHEWQKHGGCFTDEAEKYFEVGLALQNATADAMDAITAALANKQGGTMTVSEFTAVWNKSLEASGQQAYAINLVCDPMGPGKKDGDETLRFFSELQVCWKRAKGIEKGVPLSSADELVQFDCDPGVAGTFTAPCEEKFAVYGGDDNTLLTVEI